MNSKTTVLLIQNQPDVKPDVRANKNKSLNRNSFEKYNENDLVVLAA